ncbi:MAG: hypothetical protein KAQ83_01640 [Nanoarchaeota archaeon]|nr:hypothetical protein [Nanoarchaeota archaeon]
MESLHNYNYINFISIIFLILISLSIVSAEGIIGPCPGTAGYGDLPGIPCECYDETACTQLHSSGIYCNMSKGPSCAAGYTCLGSDCVEESFASSHTALSYYWYLTASDPIQQITSPPFSLDFDEELTIFNENNYLCSHWDPICNLIDESDKNYLSNYSLFFEFNEEYENIEYPFAGTFELIFPQQLPSSANVGNFSIHFCDPDELISSCNSCEIGYDMQNEFAENNFNKRVYVDNQCAGDDYIGKNSNPGDSDYRPDFMYESVDDPDFSQGFCNSAPIGVGPANKRDWNPNALCCGDDGSNEEGDLDYNNYYPDGYPISGSDYGETIYTSESIKQGLNNYNDCGKIVLNQYLCDMNADPDTQSNWRDADGDELQETHPNEGEIIFISCYPTGTGFEAVSTGKSWIRCGGTTLSEPTENSPHQFNGTMFTSPQLTIEMDDEDHSYLCDLYNDPTPKGINSIYECCGDYGCKTGDLDSDAGETNTTGEHIKLTNDNSIYYCTNKVNKQPNGNIYSSLDTESTFWTTDLDLTNRQSCEAAGFGWTGNGDYHYYEEYNDHLTHKNFCCGEADDIDSYKNGKDILILESYNDPDESGACFNATKFSNGYNIIQGEKTHNETIVINGQIFGCGVDEDNSIGTLQCSGEQGSCEPGISYKTNNYKDNSKPFKNNNWMLDLDNWPNQGNTNFEYNEEQGPLIISQNYCTIAEANGNNYFCDYDENWKQTIEDKSHLSFIEWADTEEWEQTEGLVAGCCLPEQCWNGSSCIDSQADNPMLLPYGTEEEPYRCINGAWKFSNIKYTWDREQSGYCQENSQCLANPAGIQGDPNYPQCINSNTFIGDHYCEEGQWTTRTKFLALQLLSLAPKTQPYTLYCDDYQNTLNKYNYNDVESFILYPRNLNGSQFNSVNNFCILRYGVDDRIVIATSLNHPITSNEVNFLTVFNQNIQSCPTEHSGFDQCNSQPDYIYYNEEINSIIYSKTQLDIGDSPTNIATVFQDVIDFIMENFSPTIAGTFDFITETNNFNQLYTSNQEQIVAVREKIWPTQEHISLRYWGISADVCKTIEIYDNKLGEQDYIQCEEDSGKYYISSNLQEGVNTWYLLTSKLRPQKIQ